MEKTFRKTKKYLWSVVKWFIGGHIAKRLIDLKVEVCAGPWNEQSDISYLETFENCKK